MGLFIKHITSKSERVNSKTDRQTEKHGVEHLEHPAEIGWGYPFKAARQFQRDP